MAHSAKWSKKSAPSLTLELKRSRWFLAWVAASHLLALVSIWLAPLAWTIQAPATLAILALAVHTQRRDPAHRFRQLKWFADGGAELRSQRGAVTTIDRVQGLLVLPLITTLELKHEERVVERFALFADSAHPADLRALRMRLRAAP